MGGTGNNGEAPANQEQVARGITTPGWTTSPAVAGWTGPTTSPAPETPAPVAEPRPYETAGAPSTGLLSGAAPIAGPTTGTLAAQPTGFSHTPFPTHAAPVQTYAAPEAPAAPEVPKDFAAPTSFRPIYEATSQANDLLSRKYAGSGSKGWTQDPVMAQEWLQAVADAGGDWRDHASPYYNIAAPAGMGKVYWPGDPARPK